MQFEVPYSMLLVGPSNSGKTTWLKNLIQHADALHTKPIDRIIYCYDHYQPIYDEMRALNPKKIHFVYGMPPESMLLEKRPGGENKKYETLLIMDDLMMKLNMETLSNLYTSGRQIGVNPILVLHNLTHRGRNTGSGNSSLLTISRNCSYRVLFSVPSDINNVRTLQSQMFPHLPGFLMAAYQDACCSHPYGYLVLDSRPTSDNNARAYTKIWPREETTFYIPPNHNRPQLTIPGGQVVEIDYTVQ